MSVEERKAKGREGLEAKNERYKATRHLERYRTIKDLYQDTKAAPLETIFQVGNSKDDLELEKPMTRYNNPTISFTDELRETFYAACERQGIEVDREVRSYSKR